MLSVGVDAFDCPLSMYTTIEYPMKAAKSDIHILLDIETCYRGYTNLE